MATTNARSVFLDTNILIRANVDEAPLHAETLAAIKSLRANGDALWISRQILREFVATLTRPQTFSNPRPMATIIERVRYFQTRFWVANETAVVTEKLLTLLETIPVGGKQIHDANIVATMQAYGVDHLLTLNVEDFTRFSASITLLSLNDV
jgi:predicted nucleic acid-binding protein